METGRVPEKLVSLVLETLSWIDDHAVPKCRSSNLPVDADCGTAAAGSIVKLPLECLIQMEVFELS